MFNAKNLLLTCLSLLVMSTISAQSGSKKAIDKIPAAFKHGLQQNHSVEPRFAEMIRQSTNKIWFEKNEGQFPAAVLYGFRTAFGSIAVYNNKLRVISVQQQQGEGKGQQIVDLTFPGSANKWNIVTGSRSVVLGSYNLSSGQSIKPGMFNEITLEHVYPGVNLRLYSGENGAMEFDWLVQKGSDYEKIRMHFDGQDHLKVDEYGNLELGLRFQDMKIMIPESYQLINGKKHRVDAGMQLMTSEKNTLSYTLSGNIDPNKPLVIDPVMLWSTYLDHNTGTFDEYAFSIATNSSNEVYVAGLTNVTLTQAYMSNVAAGYSAANAGTEAVVYRLNSMGTAITAWTMTGAGASNEPTDMDIFPDGRVLVVYNDGIIQIYAANLATRQYSGETVTVNEINSLAIVDNNTFFTGGTVTANLAAGLISGAPDVTRSSTEGFVMRFTNASTTPTAQWATYIGGTVAEDFTAIALTPDKTKLAFAVLTDAGGATYPALVNAVDNTLAGTELLVGVLLNQATVPAAFSVFSYLGGSGSEGDDEADTGIFSNDFRSCVIAADNNYFYVGGNTNSTNLPGTAGAVQSSNAGSYDQFVSRVPLNGSAGTGFKSTYFGGAANNDLIGGIVIDDRTSNIFIFGTTFSNDYPVQNTTPASFYYQGTFGGGSLDITYATLSNDLSQSIFSTYIGGSEKDYLGNTAVLYGTGHMYYNNNNGLVYIATTTHSAESSIPTQWMSSLPGFDKTFTGGQSTSRDHHYVFGFNPNTFDYGDAPATYEAGTPAASAVNPLINIGTGIDAENAANSSSQADGDDLQNYGVADDEDGVASLSSIAVGSTSYSVTVSVFNNSGAAINLRGWIDANGNGLFDATESATVNVPNSASQQNVTLNFSGLPAVVTSTGYTYLRLRLANVALTAANATAALGNGEVEDFRLTVSIGISGNVFNDLNGLTNNNVDGTGIGSPSGTQVYANLLNGSGNVVAVYPVDAGGTYSFTGVSANTTYSIILSLTAGTIGNPAPPAGLPGNWVNTGEDCCDNVGSDGVANDTITVTTGTVNLSNANFGIEQLPNSGGLTAASQLNPGGTSSAVVPASTFSGTDPDAGIIDSLRITAFPSNATTITINGITYTAGSFPPGGVYVPTNATGQPTQVISVDPIDGAVSVVIPYAVIDNAGREDPTPGSATVPFTTISVSGNVFSDANGLIDNTVNGTGTNAGGLNAILVNNSGNVVATVSVGPGGTYSFANVSAGDYTVLISTSTGTVGNPPPASSTPPGWVRTGEFNGTGPGSDGLVNGTSAVFTVGTSNVSNINFGINGLPNSDSKSTAISQPIVGQYITLNGGANPPSLTGDDPEDLSGGGVLTSRTVIIDVVPSNSRLYYNGVLVTNGQQINNFNPGLLQVYITNATVGSLSTSFQYSFVDAAGMKDPSPATYTLSWPAILLPVNGLDITVRLSGKTSFIDWKTESEINSHYFMVERSIDGVNFTSIYSTAAAGNSSSRRNYSYTDDIAALLQQKYIYYRIRQADLDGRVKFSNVSLVKLNTKKHIEVWPNPFAGKFIVTIHKEMGGKVNIALLDAQGKIARATSVMMVAGANQVEIRELEPLPAGTYTLRITEQDGHEYRQLIKVNK